MRDITLGNTIYIRFTTRAFATGVPTVLAGSPVLSVYEENNLTQITDGVSITVDYDSVVGLNQVTIVATTGNGYEKGKSYDLVITTGTVGGVSVVGEVVGSFTVGSIANSVWDELITGSSHNIATSAGRRLRELSGAVIRNNTAQGSGTGNNQIQLDTGASSVDGAYDPAMICIIDGTGIGQSRLIYQYNGTTKTATVDRDWKTNPDATSEFVLTGHPGREHVNEGLAQGGTSNTITLNALASSDDDVYIGQLCSIRSGTGQDQSKLIIAYNGTTKVAIINGSFDVIPDVTSGYAILPTSPVMLSTITQSSIDAIEAVLTSALTESYAADGATATLSQLLYMIWSMMNSLGFITLTGTSRKLDGSTPAMTFTIDDADNPTDINRET
jgi:hypothetical protein